MAHAWHTRCLADPVVSHAFARGHHPAHTGRLAAYWGEHLGGPARYSAELGNQSSVVRMHAGNGEHHEMDRYPDSPDDVPAGEPVPLWSWEGRVR